MDAKHIEFMRQALSESKKALPICLPNPPVGCVLVEEDKVLAKGYTHAPGKFHAEAHALSQISISQSLEQVSAYVTLEPCAFFGRTPSCAQELSKRKIKSVYVAICDPHPRNRGAGIQILKEAGIEVEIGLLSEEVRAFIELYLTGS